MGSHTSPPSLLPGRRTAYSTRSLAPGCTATLAAYCSGVSMSSSNMPSCTSPQPPRDFTLVSTRFRSPTPVARDCISPRPLCTCSSRSLTSWKLSPRRFSSVPCSFSSTVARICSSLASFSLRSSSRLSDRVLRSRSWRSPLAVVRASILAATPSICCFCASWAFTAWASSRSRSSFICRLVSDRRVVWVLAKLSVEVFRASEMRPWPSPISREKLEKRVSWVWVWRVSVFCSSSRRPRTSSRSWPGRWSTSRSSRASRAISSGPVAAASRVRCSTRTPTPVAARAATRVTIRSNRVMASA